MAYRQESNAKLSHERGKPFSTPKALPNAYFKEELSTFTNRVVRAENASAKYVTRTCGDFKNQEPAGTKPSSLHSSQMRCSPNSQKQSGADKGVEHIVLEKIYYAIRDDSDSTEDVFLSPNGGNSRQDESGEWKTEEESDRSFGGSNYNDSKEGQEENEFARTQTGISERLNVRHKRKTKDVHGSLTKECEQPFQKGHNRSTDFHVNQFAPSESHLHRPSFPRSASQMEGSLIFADSPPRAEVGDYQGTGQNTSWETPEVSSSDKRFQAQVHQDVNFQRRYPYSSTNTARLSAVSKKKDAFVCPTWDRSASGSCTANGMASGCETSSFRSKSEEESGVNFVKLRNTVEQAVLEEIRRHMGNAGETGEAQMLVHVAQDILSKAKGMGNCQNQADIAENDSNPREIVSPVGEEQSLSVLTRQDHTLQSSTSAADNARLTTMTSHEVNGGYPVVDFSREASKRRGQSLGGDCSEDIVRPKYVRHESMPELRTNERFSPDSMTDLYCSQEVINSSRQVLGQQSWNEHDIVVENTSSWRSENEKQQDEQAEFRQDGEVENTSCQKVTEEEELVGNVTNRKASPPGTAFRLCHSNLNRVDSVHAREPCENSHQRSPSSDDCVEMYRSSPSQSSQQSGHDPLHAEGASFGQPLDGLSGPTFSDDEGYKFPASIFKRAQRMQQDRHATIRVFSTLFQPFSCSQSYTTPSHQSRPSSNQKSGDSISNGRASQLSSCSSTQDSQNSQKSSSVKEGSSTSQEQQMECSSTHEDSGDQDIRILSVCSLQNKDTCVQGNVETPRSGLPEEHASKSSIEEITENQTVGAAEDPPSCFENLSDNSQDTSTREEMTDMQTAPAEDLPSCFENLSDNSQEKTSREDMTEMQTGVAENAFSSSDNASDSKRSLPSCSNCCNRNASLGCEVSYPKKSKELLDSTRWSDAKLFVCPWLNCNWRFKRNDELTRHWRKHTGEKPYPCPRCKKSFGRGDHLRCHMKTFHNLTHVDMVEKEFNRSESIQS